MSEKNNAKDWMKKIAESKGTMIAGPIEFCAQAKELMEMGNKIAEKRNEFNVMNEELKHLNENFWYALRKNYRDNKIPFSPNENLDYDIGINQEAIKDGVLIIDFIPKNISRMGQGLPL